MKKFIATGLAIGLALISAGTVVKATEQQPDQPKIYDLTPMQRNLIRNKAEAYTKMFVSPSQYAKWIEQTQMPEFNPFTNADLKFCNGQNERTATIVRSVNHETGEQEKEQVNMFADACNGRQPGANRWDIEWASQNLKN